MRETTLKPMHCQMCGIYFKKKTFSTCILAWIQLALSCLWKEVQDIRKHMQKSIKSNKSSLYYFLEFLRTRVLGRESDGGSITRRRWCKLQPVGLPLLLFLALLPSLFLRLALLLSSLHCSCSFHCCCALHCSSLHHASRPTVVDCLR